MRIPAELRAQFSRTGANMSYNAYVGSMKYGPRKGLKGPYFYPNGRVCYYDPRADAYWDPQTDWYLTHDEAMDLQGMVFDVLRGVKV